MAEKLTKIVATISDLNCGTELLETLYKNGMNVCRLNTAHQSHDDTLRVIKNIRAVSEKLPILVDTKGPEVRTQNIDSEGVSVTEGEKIIVTNGDLAGRKGFGVNYDKFVQDVPVGSTLLIDDGETGMTVIENTGDTLVCEIGNDGVIKNKKSVNVPNVHIDLPSLTQKDRDYIDFCIENKVDFIAHSFVRNKKDVLDIQEILDAAGSDIKIISKIENRAGVDNIEEIIDVSYGIMVARGDLGIEIPEEEVPVIQKQLIEACVRKATPVITATQMLHTMIKNPRPTRAEVSDVANAIYDGTDAVMLSGETAYGNYPIEAVKTMTKIAKMVESTKPAREHLEPAKLQDPVHSFLCEAGVVACEELPVKAMIIDTAAGKSARLASSYRGYTPIYAMTQDKQVMRELALSYGVYANYSEKAAGTDEMVSDAFAKLTEQAEIASEDLVAIIGKTPRANGTAANFFEVSSAANWSK